MNRTCAACAAWLLAAGTAHAATTCLLTAGAALAFGNYDPLSAAPGDSLATVSAVCSRRGGPANVSVTLQLSQGSNGSSVNARRMANTTVPGEFLNYGLFRDTGRSLVWGFSPGVDTTTQTITVPNKGSATATFTIYGRIPSLQDPAVGAYTDRVTVTVTP